MSKYIVEVIYEQVVVHDNDTDDYKRTIDIAAVNFEFESEDGEAALKDARAHMDKVLTEGLELSGGPVIRTIIPPAALKSVGIVDYEAFVEEMGVVEDLSNSSKNENQSDASIEQVSSIGSSQSTTS